MIIKICNFIIFLSQIIPLAYSQDILGCGGFVKADVDINFSLIEVKLYTKQGSLKYQTDCAPNNGYYLIPLYEKGDYILKVEPPQGWTFEPESVDLHVDGTTDKCSLSQDINFTFKGFGVLGKVISKGSTSGPEGVTVTLKKEGNDGVVQQVTSSQDGAFLFSQVLPGQYVIQATHATWTFEKASTPVTVAKGNGDVGSSLVVYGYDVKGKVLSEGEPIKGVNFILFSDNVKSQDIKNCDRSNVAGFPLKANKQPLCHVSSTTDGSFTFPSLPAGAYSLVPFYKGDHITFDVVPSQLDFTVAHATVELPQAFQVAGFSVTGKVLDSTKGLGISGASIVLDGKQQTITKTDGSYHLENMKAGTYTLQVKAEHIVFDDTTVKITPNTPQLPNIIASGFSICGQVQIDQTPDGQVAKQRQITIQAKIAKAEVKAEVKTVNTDISGKFCTNAVPGTYILKPVVLEEELEAGLRLAPLEKEVTVIKKPVFGIIFSQFRATIHGSVKCLEKCDQVEVALLVIGKLEDRHIIRVNESPEGGTFGFTDLMPGKYRLSVLEDKWCWKEKTIDFEIVDKDRNDLDFIHNGYILTCSLSHDVTLNFAHEKKAGSVGSFNLTRGANKFCLKEPGTYKLSLESCHRFEKETYSYDTSKPAVLTLTATHHLVEGVINAQEAVEDITVTIQSSIEDVATTTIKPLKVTQQETTSKKTETSKDNKKNTVKESKSSGPVSYTFRYWARAGEKIDVTPSSKVLLFYPSTTNVIVTGDKCMDKSAVFEARKGLFISGQIQPALPDVTVVITPQNQGQEVITLLTNQQGSFKVGPLHGGTEYGVTASKLGYILTPVKGKQGYFTAHKLAEIIVKVIDETSQPLSSVLLSLSGGVQYRSNNLTNVNGTMVFPELSPGQYFLRPMMKEYKFEPASKMITVEEGKTINVEIKGTRVAFSCYGAVTSLNGEPEPGVIVEAVGLNNCQQ